MSEHRDANERHDDYRRPWGIPLWQGGPINGGANWKQFVPQMLARRRGEGAIPKLAEIKETYAAAAKRLGVSE